jgi:alpha-tubulin suppressor-like RCC1 family protein
LFSFQRRQSGWLEDRGGWFPTAATNRNVHRRIGMANGEIVCWGDGTVAPPGKKFEKLAPGGAKQALALDTDQHLTLWGPGPILDPVYPATEKFTDVALSVTYVMAIRTDGTLFHWGTFADPKGTSPRPPRRRMGTSGPVLESEQVFSAIATGGAFCVGISESRLVQWGPGMPAPPPDGVFLAVSARNDYCLALREDLAIVGWGGRLFPTGPTFDAAAYLPGWTYDDDEHWVHPGPFTAIAAGLTPKDENGYPLLPHVLALHLDGRVLGWGHNTYGQLIAPPISFAAIAAGWNYSLGLDHAGNIYHWGFAGFPAPSTTIPPASTRGQLSDVPSGLFKSISAGSTHASAVGK